MSKKVLFKGKLLLVGILLVFIKSPISAQCNQFDQSEFESEFLELTEHYVNNFQISSSETQKSRFINEYLKKVESIFCFWIA
ncbi:MAG: hypothetical protein U5K72_02585 [Balneolaceae bacterium]|nr:hypothetical protein [Balneolaceae bacterium]